MRSSIGCILRSISLSRWSISASILDMLVRIALIMNMWCSVNFPSTAKAISSFVDLSFQCVQSSDNFSGLVSPAITASITAVHVLPRILENTLESFRLASSNIRIIRLCSAACCWTNFLRYRVKSLKSRWLLQGTKLPLSSPALSNLHIHAESFLSVLCPGTYLIWRAFTTMIVKPPVSRMLSTGFQ